MRKIYVLRENEEDGVLADALIERGLEPHEGSLGLPECPRCGGEVILAACREDDWALIFDSLDDGDREYYQEWRLFCVDLECSYDELVEITGNPREADIWTDLTFSSSSLDEQYPCLLGGSPADRELFLNELARYARAFPCRKAEAYLQTARWSLGESLKDIRRWLARVPTGRWIYVHLNEKKLEGRFLAATDEGLLMQAGEAGRLVAIPTASLEGFGPDSFPPVEPPRVSMKDALKNARLISLGGAFKQMVVIRGHHLMLSHVNRVGMYEVRCWDREVAGALKLNQVCANYWEGRFRRAEIEARYDTRRMARVKGYDVKVCGLCKSDGSIEIRTNDPEAAEAIGLKPQYPLHSEKDPPEILYWGDLVPPDMIEAEYEVKTYHWPLPTLGSEQGK